MGRGARLALACVGVGALLLVGLAAVNHSRATAPAKFGDIDDARLRNADSEPQNWLMYSGNDNSWRFSALDQINIDTVKDLKPAWVLEFDTDRGQEASPIVVDGVAYVSTAWNKVYAVNAKTGEQLWKWEPDNRGEKAAMACCDVVNRGVVVYRGKVFVGTIDGRLVALDAGTGKQVWSAQTIALDSTLTITGAPQVANGLVYIGNAGGDKGGRGYVSAYDSQTGELAWRFYLTPGAPGVKDNAASDEIMDSLVQPTWFGPHNEYRGGATVWGHMVYDPEFDQLLLATGNGFPWSRYHRSAGKGDNLFLASVVALDARTGRYKWHYQETPGEEWDLAATADLVMADLPIDGKMTKVVMHAPKAGVFFIIDRETGKLASGAPFVPGMNWFKGFNPDGSVIVNEAAHYDNKTPARSNGFARNWFPMSWNPQTQLMYLNATQGPPGINYPKETFEWRREGTGIGIYTFGEAIPEELRKIDVPMPANAAERRAYLMAWDPVKQQPAWQTDGNGNGVLTTAGNLVFQGTSRNVMGELKAFRADNGELVWSYKTPNAILTSPVSYMIDGEQYLLVPTGAAFTIFGGGADLRARQPGRLVAFKLNGTATLPPDPPPAGPIQAPPDSETWTDTELFDGSQLFAHYCAHCHGIATRNNNVIPDLKRSPLLNNAAAWKTVVEDGALKDRGMISWAHLLPPGGAETIRHFVQNEARKALAAPPPSGPAGPALAPTEAAIQGGL